MKKKQNKKCKWKIKHKEGGGAKTDGNKSKEKVTKESKGERKKVD